LDSFIRLAKTNRVEFIGETYYHSLASIYSEEEFAQQVEAQSAQ
jgi:alpha-amylase